MWNLAESFLELLKDDFCSHSLSPGSSRFTTGGKGVLHGVHTLYDYNERFF